MHMLRYYGPWAGRDVVTAAQRVSLLFDLLRDEITAAQRVGEAVHFMVTSSG